MTTVADAMTVDVLTIGDDTVPATPGISPNEAADLMRGHGVRHLPVVEDDRLLGVVAIRDLLVRAHYAVP
jgi:CBS domain-containing protein